MRKRRPGSSETPADTHDETPPTPPTSRPDEYADAVPESYPDDWTSAQGGTERETYEDRVEREQD